jgi:hypothetical protein
MPPFEVDQMARWGYDRPGHGRESLNKIKPAIFAMITTICISLAAATIGIFLWVGCAPRGRALRPTCGRIEDPLPTTEKADAWYIESTPVQDGRPFSCSFIEFDERGDYLDFQQHRHAYAKIKDLAQQGERMLVVIYVHGWKNNSQSGDVVEFNSFLKRIATSPFAREGGFRVHGVYLAWRGNVVPHALDEEDEFFKEMKQAFGGKPIVNTRYSRKLGFLYWLPEQLSYWNRRNAAEDKVSGVSIIRTIFTCGHTARRYSKCDAPNRIFLMGHSFGALMLEQSFAPASLARLTAEWPWDDEEAIARARANPLPFDLVMLINSAAPSIYAKQLYNYMVAHQRALSRNKIVGADAPLVISLTSVADSATLVAHKWANVLASLYPSLWREYDGSDFILATNTNTSSIKIPQAYYYRRTPGHNPLLVSHWIVPAKDGSKPDAKQSLLHQNLNLNRAAELTTHTFYTSDRIKTDKSKKWEITRMPPKKDSQWSTYRGIKPLCVDPAVRSCYWIVRCPKEIISGHNDIWSQQAMETYAALFREAEFLRAQTP